MNTQTPIKATPQAGFCAVKTPGGAVIRVFVEDTELASLFTEDQVQALSDVLKSSAGHFVGAHEIRRYQLPAITI